jgi:hypothetical protein
MEEKKELFIISRVILLSPSLCLIPHPFFHAGQFFFLSPPSSTNYSTINCKYTSEVEMIPHNLLMKKSAAAAEAERAFKLEKRSSSSSS